MEIAEPSIPPQTGPLAARPQPFFVLVVDDNEANRDALSRRLERRGYAVASAQDGPEALKLIEQRSFDLVLLDIMMPGMSGLEVLERLRKIHPPTRLPVIMATAKDQSEDIVKALRLGANDYVTKPLDFPVVLARVQTHLALKQSVQQVIDLEQRLSQRNAELEAANGQLVHAAERTRRDLQAAARIQESFLPKSQPRLGRMRFAWTFKPCESLAGDSLNICPLGAEHAAVYVLDVAGHGVASALSAVAATRVLSPASDPESLLVHRSEDAGATEPAPPAEVAGRLAGKFAWNSMTEQFLTLFYAVLNVHTGQCRYVSAGHPGAIHLAQGKPPVTLAGSGLPIGVGENYEEHAAHLNPGDRLYLYSDGVTEAMNPKRDLFGVERLTQCLEQGRSLGLQESISLLLKELDDWCDHVPARDDISIVAVERDGAMEHEIQRQGDSPQSR